MRPELLTFCENFIKNRDVVKSVFPMENSYMYPICAAIFTSKGMVIDADKLRECNLIFKGRVGAFSSFRGISRPVIVSMIASDKAPDKRLENALLAYDALKKRFTSGSYLPLGAMILSGETDETTFSDVTAKAREIYELMRKNHPFLTSEEDIVYAILFALGGERCSDSIIEMERIYNGLKKKFRSSNDLQALSHVLALCDGDADEKCEKAVALFDSLRENKLRYGAYRELATLGILASLPASREELLIDMKEVNAFLLTQKGFGSFFGLDTQARLMIAAMIVSDSRLDSIKSCTASTTAAISAQIAAAAQQAALIAAQNAALCATIAAQSSAH